MDTNKGENMRVKQGDVVLFTQEDGNTLTLLVYPDGIAIKSDFPGTELTVNSDSSFFITTKATQRPDKEEIITTIRYASLNIPCNRYMSVLKDFSLTSFNAARLEEIPFPRLVNILDRIRLENRL